ncbi:MAG TPA: cyclic dehypoxanthinyl futalosine synthase [Candidatus Acidoferrales bacterium]|nr:cyclic dehypoxanthinyl futalosine synthase [Candidatus Acidoferrales bacterium]
MGIQPQEALEMFRSDDLIGLGMAANQVRKKRNDARIVTYQIDRNINYTNFCTEYCSFCAFYRPMGSKEGYLLPFETIFQKIEEMLELGGTGVLMQGGLNPDLHMDYYQSLLRSIRQRYPSVHLHCFSAPEILCIAEVSGLTVRDTIAHLRDAGLDSIPGGGAEILDDEIRRRISRLKCTSEEWVEVHRTAHALGLRTTATMMFGCGEEYRHRVNHFECIRRIQEDTGGFTAFIPWMFAPENTALGKRVAQATAADYLKTLAIARLYLDNIDHIQSSWLTPGIKVCQVGLQFGADDVGSILIEENVVYAAGVRNRTNEAELRRIIHDAGYIPAQRDTLYRSYFLK